MAHLVRRWTFRCGPVAALELHLTPDIVALPPAVGWDARTGMGVNNFALLTSSNPLLEPPQFTTSEAAAAFPGTNIIYPEQIVDGRLYEFGGHGLQKAVQAAHPVVNADGARCEVGAAVRTGARYCAKPLAQLGVALR